MSKIISALAFATLLSLPASAAPNSANCPALEGYPDCHNSNSYREYPRDLAQRRYSGESGQKDYNRGTPCIIAGTMLGVQQGRHRCCEPQGTIRSSRDGIEVK